MKTICIIGAGPAGLTAGYQLLTSGEDCRVVIFEESDSFGGISKTVNYKGNRMDMGGHRFFSKVPEVNEWWQNMLPLQGSPSYDDIVLGRKSDLQQGGPDPQNTDIVMLRRNRVSRILFNGRFFDYPISLKPETFTNMGLVTTIHAGFSYLHAVVFKRRENSLEDFYINRFGKKLYSMFFEHYTENLWGRHPSQIDPSWGAQRVKGVSVIAVLKNAVQKVFGGNSGKETSLIESFSYPKLGPGQLWEITADRIQNLGGEIIKGARVVRFHQNKHGRIDNLTYIKNGQECTVSGDIFISSMPVRDLVAGINNMPEEAQRIASGLPYRDYMTVGVLLNRHNLKNRTHIPTLGNIVPDNWVYVHDRSVKMGRFQLYNNWSPYMVENPDTTIWMGLEYFCNEGDELWNLHDDAFSEMAINEMIALKLIDSRENVLDSHVERVKKAYPAYFDTYKEMDTLIEYLNKIENLYCIGRNGQHRYNNIDHSMCTAFEAVSNIINGVKDKTNIWNINTEKAYHEQK